MYPKDTTVEVLSLTDPIVVRDFPFLEENGDSSVVPVLFPNRENATLVLVSEIKFLACGY